MRRLFTMCPFCKYDVTFVKILFLVIREEHIGVCSRTLGKPLKWDTHPFQPYQRFTSSGLPAFLCYFLTVLVLNTREIFANGHLFLQQQSINFYLKIDIIPQCDNIVEAAQKP